MKATEARFCASGDAMGDNFRLPDVLISGGDLRGADDGSDPGPGGRLLAVSSKDPYRGVSPGAIGAYCERE